MEVIAGNIGLGVGVPLEGDAAGVSVSGEGAKEAESGEKGEDRPRSRVIANPVNYGNYSRPRAFGSVVSYSTLSVPGHYHLSGSFELQIP